MTQNKKSCSCSKNHKMDRLMEIGLLLSLYGNVCHGYALVEKLQQFGYSDDQVNISTLYRNLRKLEEAGYVHSDWEEGGPGPKRRVCHLTEVGVEHLHQAIRFVKERRTRMNQILNQYESLMNHEQMETDGLSDPSTAYRDGSEA